MARFRGWVLGFRVSGPRTSAVAVGEITSLPHQPDTVSEGRHTADSEVSQRTQRAHIGLRGHTSEDSEGTHQRAHVGRLRGHTQSQRAHIGTRLLSSRAKWARNTATLIAATISIN